MALCNYLPKQKQPQRFPTTIHTIIIEACIYTAFEKLSDENMNLQKILVDQLQVITMSDANTHCVRFIVSSIIGMFGSMLHIINETINLFSLLSIE